MNIVFLCTGNTCRSPLAERMFKKINSEHCVTSAGLLVVEGEGASENMIIAARDFDIDLTDHKAKLLTKDIIEKTDLFVCLSQRHKEQIVPYIGEGSVYVLGGGICDPYGCDLSYYKSCAKEIHEAVLKFNEKINDLTLIRFMTKEDVSQVHEIEKECFNDPWSEKSLLEEIENENARFFVADVAGEIAGYVGTISVVGECSVTNIAVKEKFRRHHFATRLMERAISSSIFAGDEFITLEVRKSNTPAIDMYKIFGFKKVGFRKDFYRHPQEDAYTMKRELRIKENENSRN